MVRIFFQTSIYVFMHIIGSDQPTILDLEKKSFLKMYSRIEQA
jgi:hypothetical protein